MSDDKNHDGATETRSLDRGSKEQPNGRSAKERPNDDKGSSEQPKKEKKGSGKPPKKVLIIAALVFAILAVGGVLYYLHAQNFESTDDAFTAGHVHEISSRVAGTVQAVLVNDNQAVHKGDPLASLDPREFNLVREKAVAQVAQARAMTEQANAELSQRQAATAQSSAQLEKAMTDYNRIGALYQQDIKAVAKAEVDAANAQLKTARGAFEATKANETAARAQVAVAQAGVTTAETALHDAELQFSYTSIAAPVDGFVAKKSVESGRRIQPGQALMAVVERHVWVVANYKETQLAQIKIGQSVAIDIDAIPDHEFKGHVDSFQPGTGATFSLLPPDNATGNFTKIVQRIPVKIVFDQESVRSFHNRIVPGLSVAPTIDLRTR
ncbi:MAG: efflux RND transporter periplasmic adaptor subunit [Chthoniobacterales bacterium]